MIMHAYTESNQPFIMTREGTIERDDTPSV